MSLETRLIRPQLRLSLISLAQLYVVLALLSAIGMPLAFWLAVSSPFLIITLAVSASALILLEVLPLIVGMVQALGTMMLEDTDNSWLQMKLIFRWGTFYLLPIVCLGFFFCYFIISGLQVSWSLIVLAFWFELIYVLAAGIFFPFWFTTLIFLRRIAVEKVRRNVQAFSALGLRLIGPQPRLAARFILAAAINVENYLRDERQLKWNSLNLAVKRLNTAQVLYDFVPPDSKEQSEVEALCYALALFPDISGLVQPVRNFVGSASRELAEDFEAQESYGGIKRIMKYAVSGISVVLAILSFAQNSTSLIPTQLPTRLYQVLGLAAATLVLFLLFPLARRWAGPELSKSLVKLVS